MKTYCPYCGTEMDCETTRPGESPGTLLCPGCGREVTPPPEAGQTEAMQGQGHVNWDSPPPPPPPPPPGGDGPAGGDQVSPGEEDWLGPDSIAWEKSGPILGRLGRSIHQVMLRPHEVFASRFRPSLIWPTSFAILMVTLISVIEFALRAGQFKAEWIIPSILFTLLFAGPLVLVAMLIGSAIATMGLSLVRGNQVGYWGTYRVVAYSTAVSVLSLIPLWPGASLFLAWSIVVHIIGLAAAHGISHWRAFCGFALGPVLIFVLFLFSIGLSRSLKGFMQNLSSLGVLG